MITAIDTARVRDRRQLHFRSLNDVLAEVDRIAAADRAGKLRRTGNWTAGQVFGHLATWINYGYEGFPFRVPWFVRFVLKRRVKAYLEAGMPAGARIPKVAGGTYGTEALLTEEGARRLRAAIQRLANEPPNYHSPAFGEMTEDERLALHLRHAELHMSFLHPDSPVGDP